MSKTILVINPAAATSILLAAIRHQFELNGADVEVSFKNIAAPAFKEVLDLWSKSNPAFAHNPPLLVQEICNEEAGERGAQLQAGLVAICPDFFNDEQSLGGRKYPFLYEKASDEQDSTYTQYVLDIGKRVLNFESAQYFLGMGKGKAKYPDHNPESISEAHVKKTPDLDINKDIPPVVKETREFVKDDHKSNPMNEELPTPLEKTPPTVHEKTAETHIKTTKEIGLDKKENTHDRAEVDDVHTDDGKTQEDLNQKKEKEKIIPPVVRETREFVDDEKKTPDESLENPKPLENVHAEDGKTFKDVQEKEIKEEVKSKELKDFIGGPENAKPDWKKGDPFPGEEINPDLI